MNPTKREETVKKIYDEDIYIYFVHTTEEPCAKHPMRMK